jgi:8-oxo-dGTP diphosphatase
MGEALTLARRGLDADEMPIGAIVVLDGDVIGSSYWRYAPDGLLDHAEMVALQAAAKDRRIDSGRGRTTLYTTLEPCLMCMGAAMSLGIGRIVFALEARFDGASTVTKVWRPELGFPRPGFELFTNPVVLGGVCREASLGLMSTYVGNHPEWDWVKVMLPDFSYPAAPAPDDCALDRCERVIAYIVRDGRLLVFVHEEDVDPLLDSGLQVPGGTVEPGETSQEAVLREAEEETGLECLRIVCYLGEDEFDARPNMNAIVRRHFFQLAVDGDAPAEWRNVETCASDGSGPHPFRLFWIPLEKAPLVAGAMAVQIGRVVY